MKKKLISVIVIIVTLLLLVSSIISYANTSETIYINLAKVNAEGIGYAIDNPITSSQAHYIWNLVTYNSNNVSDISAKQRNLYCIKANYGNSWITNETQIVPYNLSYDLQDDIEKLRAIVDNSNGADDVVKALLNPDNSTKGYYRELLWILDNLYIENQTDKNAFLENIGFKYNSKTKYSKNFRCKG